MYNKRQIVFQCPLHLFFKDNHLLLTEGLVPIQVNTHLTDSIKAMRRRSQIPFHFFQTFLPTGIYRCGMKTNHRIAAIVRLTQLKHSLDRRIINVRHKQASHSCFDCTNHRQFTVGIKFFSIKMGMSINQGVHIFTIYGPLNDKQTSSVLL